MHNFAEKDKTKKLPTESAESFNKERFKYVLSINAYFTAGLKTLFEIVN